MNRLDALRAAIRRLEAENIDDARRDAKFLLGQVLEGGEVALISGPDMPLKASEEVLLERFLQRRGAGEPCSRILGWREFWSMTFRVTEDVLDPRPESETLVEALLEAFPDRKAALRILDLGTGSGCLLLALLSEYRDAYGLGIDLSEGAVTIATENAQALGLGSRVEFQCLDWRDGLGIPENDAERWDIILSNPPYIESDAIPKLMREVRDFDPKSALDGGEDGLDAYREIAHLAENLLKPQGLLALELGMGQAGQVSEILRAHDLSPSGLRRDLSGIERVILANFPKK